MILIKSKSILFNPLFVFLIFISFSCSASKPNSTDENDTQERKYVDTKRNVTENSIPETIESTVYRSNISSVLLYKKNLDLSDPVIQLNTTESFEFHFDVLDHDFESFQYKIIHCNENWSISDLDEMEYYDGFNDI